MGEFLRQQQGATTYMPPVTTPEPFEGEYGPIRDEVFAYIAENTDQEVLAGGMIGQQFEW